MHSEGPLISLASGKDAIVAEMAHYGNLSRRSRTPAVSTRTVGCRTQSGFGVGLQHVVPEVEMPTRNGAQEFVDLDNDALKNVGEVDLVGTAAHE